jgi:hypothetical protein
MTSTDAYERIRVAPQGLATGEQKPNRQARVQETYPARHGDVVVIWEWEDETVRMDIAAPAAVTLEIALPIHAKVVYVNGEIVWGNNAFQSNHVGVAEVGETAGGLHLACPAGGAYHILARTGSSTVEV